MNLEHEFTYHARLKEPVAIGRGPYGDRIFFEVIDGVFEGKLSGRALSGGGDWLLVGSDGFARLDVRAQVLTDDGALVYLQYFGLLEMNDKVQQAMAAGKGTDYGDQYFRTNPRFETGDPRYAWLQQAFFVGEGRLLPERTVQYRVYRLT
jgi:Protein of unknown function (DUF3237)